MKNKLIIGILLVSSAFVSCKNEKADAKDSKEIAKIEEDKSFNVIFDMIVEKDDNFQIYYNEDGSEVFPADKYVDVAVKGKPGPQEIVFKLPEDAFPESLRFDIGGNKEQSEMKILNFKMKYYDKTFEAKDTLFIYYFGYNDQIDYIRDKAIAKAKPIANQIYDPIFIAKPSLKDQLKKMVK